MARNDSRRELNSVLALALAAVGTFGLLWIVRDARPAAPAQSAMEEPLQLGTAMAEAKPSVFGDTKPAAGADEQNPDPGSQPEKEKKAIQSTETKKVAEETKQKAAPVQMARVRPNEPSAPPATVTPEPLPPPPPPPPVPLKYRLEIQKRGGTVADGAEESIANLGRLAATVYAEGNVPAGARIELDWISAEHGHVAPFAFGPEQIGRAIPYNNKIWADTYTVILKVDGAVWEEVKFKAK